MKLITRKTNYFYSRRISMSDTKEIKMFRECPEQLIYKIVDADKQFDPVYVLGSDFRYLRKGSGQRYYIAQWKDDCAKDSRSAFLKQFYDRKRAHCANPDEVSALVKECVKIVNLLGMRSVPNWLQQYQKDFYRTIVGDVGVATYCWNDTIKGASYSPPYSAACITLRDFIRANKFDTEFKERIVRSQKFVEFAKDNYYKCVQQHRIKESLVTGAIVPYVTAQLDAMQLYRVGSNEIAVINCELKYRIKLAGKIASHINVELFDNVCGINICHYEVVLTHKTFDCGNSGFKIDLDDLIALSPANSTDWKIQLESNK